MHLESSKNGQFIQFRASDLKKDAGQSTVPFFDAVGVYGTPSIPLGGLGIAHSYYFESGGYITFKVMGLDMTKYINTNISENN